MGAGGPTSRGSASDTGGQITWTGEEAPTPGPADGEGGGGLDVVRAGAYEVREELARGAVGRILLANDHRLHRTVAIKELRIRGGMHEKRFVREARITARLQHPGIVPVYDAARWPDGTPFFVMKVVEGQDLGTALAATTTLSERLALVPHLVPVCEAIAYAHSKHIIHRDIKPANVLIGDFGETVVVDWGLARRLGDAEANEPDSSEVTRVGTVVGSPAYMSPEQGRGEVVDVRADVYAIGATLYHVLAGRPPYEGPAPAVLVALLHAPPAPLGPEVPPELGAIVHKAMARRPEDRYADADGIAADLRRYQAGHLVGAHEYTARERLVRTLRQYRVAIAIAAALWIGLSVSAAVFVGGLVQARQEAVDAMVAETARVDELTLLQARVALDTDPSAALVWLASLSDASARFAEGRTVAADALERGVSRVYHHADVVIARPSFSADGRSLVTAGDDGVVRVWDIATHGVRVLDAHAGQAWDALLTGDHQLVASYQDGTARLWDTATGEARTLGVHPEPVVQFTLLPGHVVLGGKGSLAIYDLATGHGRLRTAPPVRQWGLASSPDGRRIASSADDGSVWVWDVESGEHRKLVGHRSAAYHVAFSPDGSRLASVSGDETARLWDLATGESLVLAGHEGGVYPSAFSPDGRRLATAGADRTVRIWDVATGAPITVLRGHEGTVVRALFLADGRVVSAGEDRSVRVWDVATGRSRRLVGHTGALRDLVLLPDGSGFATTATDGSARLWSLPDAPLVDAGVPVAAIAIGPDAAVAVLGADDSVRVRGADGTVRLLRGPGGLVGEEEKARLTELEFDRGFRPGKLVWMGGGRLAATRHDHGIDVLGGDRAASIAGHGDHVSGLAVSPDGKWLVSADLSGLVLAWDGERAVTVHQAGKAVNAVSFAPDGRLAIAGQDGTVVVTRVGAAETAVAVTQALPIGAVAWSPDGSRLLAAGDALDVVVVAGGATTSEPATGMRVDKIVFSGDGSRVAGAGASDRIWVQDGATSRVFTAHGTDVIDLALSPDGRRLATAGADATVRLWDLTVPGTPSRVLAHDGAVVDVAWLSDEELVSASVDGTVRRWRDDLPWDRAALEAAIDRIVDDRYGPGTAGQAP